MSEHQYKKLESLIAALGMSIITILSTHWIAIVFMIIAIMEWAKYLYHTQKLMTESTDT